MTTTTTTRSALSRALAPERLVIGWCIDAFFMVDICVNLRTGFMDTESGAAVLDPTRAARAYVGSVWFVIDVITTVRGRRSRDARRARARRARGVSRLVLLRFVLMGR